MGTRSRILDLFLLLALLFALCCFRPGSTRDLTYGDNEFCGPKPTLISIDHPSYRHIPYYVTLYRCGGSVNYQSPSFKICAASKICDVSIQLRNLDTDQRKTIVEKNHTSCAPQCANNKSMCNLVLEEWNSRECTCDCKFPNGPPEPCPTRFKWSPSTCKCQCNNEESQAFRCSEEGKSWSAEKCACECSPRTIQRCLRTGREIDETTCRCKARNPVFGFQKARGEEKGISKIVFVSALLGELLLLVFIFVCLLWKFDFLSQIRNSICKSDKRGEYTVDTAPKGVQAEDRV
ncbi:uncharacterized protein LOC124435565 [Xenia sp. Carnegie-2017]|uniref:uncharacterized protein LOC124435565 n=1 Tax=Xenia sp. Carnegie-2017 TaxID=2897299 RepID=UPI001F0415E3|nr:uncharacterized protein LOC124435565 [Xenia sp. Carnegie-2017]